MGASLYSASRDRLINPYANSGFMPALTFGANTSDKIDFGNPGNVSAASIMVMGVWVFPTTFTSARRMITKNALDGVSGGPFLALSGTAGEVQVANARTVTNANAVSNTTPLVLNTWTCLVGVLDPADTQPRLYAGTDKKNLTEVGYAGGAAQGSGTTAGTANVVIGNSANVAPTSAFQGRIGGKALWLVGRAPKLDELIAWQRSDYVPIGATIAPLVGWNGAGPQRDWSGFNNHGTVTGATYSPFGVPRVTAPAFHWRAA